MAFTVTEDIESQWITSPWRELQYVTFRDGLVWLQNSFLMYKEENIKEWFPMQTIRMLTTVFAFAVWSFSVCLQKDGLLDAHRRASWSLPPSWLILPLGYRGGVQIFGHVRRLIRELKQRGSSWAQKRRAEVIREWAQTIIASERAGPRHQNATFEVEDRRWDASVRNFVFGVKLFGNS